MCTSDLPNDGMVCAVSRSPEQVDEQAEPLYKRPLAIDEMTYGPDHPGVGRDLNNWAALLRV